MKLQIILGDQLFPRKFYSEGPKHIFMCEDFGLCTHFKYHKHKIIFFLASMRHFRDELEEIDKTVHYQELDKSKDFFSSLEKTVSKLKPNKIKIYEVEDKFFWDKLNDFCNKKELELEIDQTPMFVTSRSEFNNYAKNVKRPFMKTFYEKKRRELDILMNKDGRPTGGKFSFDESNRKKIPKKEGVPKVEMPDREDHHVASVKKLVDKHFACHPGETDNFWAAVTRRQALSWYNSFLDDRFDKFGDYQDALDERDPFLYHAVISPYMNNGFIPAKEVIDKALDAKAPLNCKEGFVRQVLGWREFMRGIYHRYGEKEAEENFFNHKRLLTKDWYEGTTGIEPLDLAIKKANKFAYCHHIERLMVLSNIMLLCEISPKEVYKWFMEMFIDSADWVMTPNFYGMGQFSDGGIFATKPYISGSNYIRKMGHYPKGDWCDIVDGLYWRFIDRKLNFFKEQPRMSVMVKNLEKMDNERKDRIFKAASVFLEEKTTS
ncbi:MAG: cryptochrome/photolyase family protein [Peredibacter sp.]|nr:cryptochrome/photolyase family protein [Peredibacter sp.]